MSDDIIFGIHAVTSLLKTSDRVDTVWVQKNRQDKTIEELLALCREKHIAVNVRQKTDLDKLVSDQNHQGVVASCQPQFIGDETDLMQLIQSKDSKIRLLFLDGVQDPHNLGACMRSAYAFGVDAVISPKDKSVGLTSVARKVACGAAEVLPFFQVTNLARTIRDCQEENIWFYGADSETTESIQETDFSGHVAWVLGAEGKGLREGTKKACDFLVKIPMKNPIQSLNVSVACGICLYASM